MKLTKRHLQRIIKEELTNVLNEQTHYTFEPEDEWGKINYGDPDYEGHEDPELSAYHIADFRGPGPWSEELAPGRLEPIEPSMPDYNPWDPMMYPLLSAVPSKFADLPEVEKEWSGKDLSKYGGHVTGLTPDGDIEFYAPGKYVYEPVGIPDVRGGRHARRRRSPEYRNWSGLNEEDQEALKRELWRRYMEEGWSGADWYPPQLRKR